LSGSWDRGEGYDTAKKGSKRNATPRRLPEKSGLPWSIDKFSEGLSSQKMLQQWQISKLGSNSWRNKTERDCVVGPTNKSFDPGAESKPSEGQTEQQQA
jgi:hypothetical protein